MKHRRRRTVLASVNTAREGEEWPEWLREELASSEHNGCVGRQVVAENARARIWRARLEPRERIAFHSHVLDYFWIALTDGKLQSRDSSGGVHHYDISDGTVYFRRVLSGESQVRDLENIGTGALNFMVVEFLDSGNPPLPVPDHVRVK